MNRSTATIKKFIFSQDIGTLRSGFLVFLPYLACSLFLEIFYHMMSVFFVYGKWIGIPLGTAAVFLLFTVIVGSFFSSNRSRLALLLIFDCHIALSAAMFVRIAAGHPAGVPVWILLSRSIFTPLELCAVFLLTIKNDSAG